MYAHTRIGPSTLIMLCGHSSCLLSNIQNASDTMLRVLEATENSVGPQSRSNQSPDRAGDTDDRDCVSSTSCSLKAPHCY